MSYFPILLSCENSFKVRRQEEIEGIILLDVVMEFLVDEAIIVDAE